MAPIKRSKKRSLQELEELKWYFNDILDDPSYMFRYEHINYPEHTYEEYAEEIYETFLDNDFTWSVWSPYMRQIRDIMYAEEGDRFVVLGTGQKRFSHLMTSLPWIMGATFSAFLVPPAFGFVADVVSNAFSWLTGSYDDDDTTQSLFKYSVDEEELAKRHAKDVVLSSVDYIPDQDIANAQDNYDKQQQSLTQDQLDKERQEYHDMIYNNNNSNATTIIGSSYDMSHITSSGISGVSGPARSNSTIGSSYVIHTPSYDVFDDDDDDDSNNTAFTDDLSFNPLDSSNPSPRHKNHSMPSSPASSQHVAHPLPKLATHEMLSPSSAIAPSEMPFSPLGTSEALASSQEYAHRSGPHSHTHISGYNAQNGGSSHNHPHSANHHTHTHPHPQTNSTTPKAHSTTHISQSNNGNNGSSSNNNNNNNNGHPSYSSGPPPLIDIEDAPTTCQDDPSHVCHCPFQPLKHHVVGSITDATAGSSTPIYGPYHVTLPANQTRVHICQCGQSATFPHCDGAHRAYNQKHGTSLAPWSITKQEYLARRPLTTPAPIASEPVVSPHQPHVNSNIDDVDDFVFLSSSQLTMSTIGSLGSLSPISTQHTVAQNDSSQPTSVAPSAQLQPNGDLVIHICGCGHSKAKLQGEPICDGSHTHVKPCTHK